MLRQGQVTYYAASLRVEIQFPITLQRYALLILKLLKLSPVGFQSHVLWGLVLSVCVPSVKGAWCGVCFSGLVVSLPLVVSPAAGGLVLNHVSAGLLSTINFGRFFSSSFRSFSELDA